MNDELRHIYNQASSSFVTGSTSYETKTNFLNRFAELIIRRCAQISESAEPYQSHDLILQRFGLFHE